MLVSRIFFLYPKCFISFNPFPHNDTFWHPWKTSLLKTLWEKEKLLTTSNFSFSHSVFYPFAYFLPFSSNLKLSTANSFSLEESKNLSSGNGLRELRLVCTFSNFLICKYFNLNNGKICHLAGSAWLKVL